MTEQGYPPKTNCLEQDNESAIKLEVNGCTSAAVKSRHLNIQYFWIEENLETINIKVCHCHTSKMLADFFTNPLQGSLFRKFRDLILGKHGVHSLDSEPHHPVKARVEEDSQGRQETDDKKKIINDKGFTLMRKKRKHTGAYVEINVAKINGFGEAETK
jgi:hypothetical protein